MFPYKMLRIIGKKIAEKKRNAQHSRVTISELVMNYK